MADRLTQLQDAVNVQADNLTNSIGILQQLARPNNFPFETPFDRGASTAYQQTLTEMGVIPPAPPAPPKNEEGEENGIEGAVKTNGIGGQTNCSSEPMNGDMTNGQSDQPDNGKLFSRLIAKTAKDIDVIIDSLPNREMESELQEAHIRRLEEENKEQARKLEATIKHGEEMLEMIKNALEDIAQNQMRMEQIEARNLSNLDGKRPLG